MHGEYYMKKSYLYNTICAALFLLNLVSTPVYASSIYTYMGNQFEEFDDDLGSPGIVPGSYNTSMSVNGFFELVNPLSLNTKQQVLQGQLNIQSLS